MFFVPSFSDQSVAFIVFLFVCTKSVHRSRNTPKSQFVLSTLLKRQLSRKVYPVHRLDHRTSGAILFAFDPNTCGLLHKSLTFGNINARNSIHTEAYANEYINTYETLRSNGEQGSSQKEYIALLRGHWKQKFETDTVVVDKPLNVEGVTKEAVTEFHLLACYPGPNNTIYHPSACSLVICKPRTGRTHQIRRHAYSIGVSIIKFNIHQQ